MTNYSQAVSQPIHPATQKSIKCKRLETVTAIKSQNWATLNTCAATRKRVPWLVKNWVTSDDFVSRHTKYPKLIFLCADILLSSSQVFVIIIRPISDTPK